MNTPPRTFACPNPSCHIVCSTRRGLAHHFTLSLCARTHQTLEPTALPPARSHQLPPQCPDLGEYLNPERDADIGEVQGERDDDLSTPIVQTPTDPILQAHKAQQYPTYAAPPSANPAESQAPLSPDEIVFAEVLKQVSHRLGDKLLRVLHSPGFTPRHIRFKTSVDMYLYAMEAKGKKWAKPVNMAKPTDNQELWFHYVEDPIQELRRIVEDPLNRHMRMCPVEETNEADEQVFNTFQSGLAFRTAFYSLPPNSLLIPVSLWADGSQLSLGSKGEFHQVAIRVPSLHKNDVNNDRSRGLLALVPTYKPTGFGVDTFEFRRRKRELLHECLEIVLKALKQASWTGAIMQPQGYPRTLCYPWLAFVNVDLLEAWNLASLKAHTVDLHRFINKEDITRLYMEPVSQLTPRNSSQLSESVDLAIAIRASGARGCVGEAKKVEEHFNIFPVVSALRGFRGTDPVHCISTCDITHQDNSGVVLQLTLALVYDIKQFFRLSSNTLSIINVRLSELARMSAVGLPSNVAEVRFPTEYLLVCSFFLSELAHFLLTQAS